MGIIKVRFLRNCEPYGREYSYLTKEPVAVGDVVQVETQLGVADVQVTAVNVPEKEVESFKEKLKYVIGKKPKTEEKLIIAKQTHCGQYQKYGDFFRVWEIETESDNEELILERCFDTLNNGQRLPEEKEWRENIRYGSGKHAGDYDYYFKGYYKLQKTSTGYEFTICEPYAD